MKCPACSVVNLVMAERQGIEIDYCPQCRGVWLDRGELDKLIERNLPPSREDERDWQSSQDRERIHKRRRRGMLGELFDFD